MDHFQTALIYLFILYHSHNHYVDLHIGPPPSKLLTLLYLSLNITLSHSILWYLQLIFIYILGSGIMPIKHIPFLLILLTGLVRWIWTCVINIGFCY